MAEDSVAMNFSFAGCGFNGIYHVGVASCLREYVPHLVERKISGASAGAALACILLCKCPLGLCTTWTMKIASQTKKKSLGPMHPTVDLSELLEEGLREALPPNAHEICTGRLHVSLTRVPDKKNVIVSEFKTFDELIQVLLCSAYIPYFSGLVIPSYRGSLYMDGAASDNVPRIDEHTVTVSPFAGTSADICPSDGERLLFPYVLEDLYGFRLSAANVWRLVNILYPPDPDRLSDICKQGFSDTLKYLQKHKLINCPRHLKVKSKVVKVHRSKNPEKRRRRRSKSPSEHSKDSSHRGEERSEKETGLDSVDALRACEECHKKMTGEFTLPATVSEALEEAVALVNTGLLGYMRRTRLYKLWSLAVTPFYVPVDLYMHFLLRIAKWLPRCLTDTRKFVSTLMFCLMWISKEVVERGKINFKRVFEKLVHHELELSEGTFETKEIGGSFSSSPSVAAGGTDKLDVDIPIQVSPSKLQQLTEQVNHLFEHELSCPAQRAPPLSPPVTHLSPPVTHLSPPQPFSKEDSPMDSEPGHASFHINDDSLSSSADEASDSNERDDQDERESTDEGLGSVRDEEDFVHVSRDWTEFGRRHKKVCSSHSCEDTSAGHVCSCGCDVCLDWEDPDALTRVSTSDSSMAHTVLSYHYQDDNGDIQETKIFARAIN